LKFLVIYLIVERNFPAASRDRLVLLVGALFALPYILFSLAAGILPIALVSARSPSDEDF